MGTADYHVPELVDYEFAEVRAAESLLLGRVTHDSSAAAWPGRDGAFADAMDAMPEHVATSRPGDLGWNATALSGDVPAAVADLKDGDGGPILVVGSATLARILLAHGLVDELRLMVFPVAIGGGLRVFPEDRGRAAFALTDLERYDNGIVLQVYRPVPARR